MDAPRRGSGRGFASKNDRKRAHNADSPALPARQPPSTRAPAPRALPPRAATPPLSEAVPLDTPRFVDLGTKAQVDPVILQTITQDMKFDRMMPVQAATLEALLPPKRADCLVQAKTGTGKTIAFLIPAIQTLIGKNRGRNAGISLLVISPTRELAMQIAKEAGKLLQRMPKYRVCIAIGGTNKNVEEKQILAGCDILIATPGRLFDHLSNSGISDLFRHLDTLVLDEADRLLDMGFLGSLKDIVKCLPDKAATNRQGMLFSATIAPHVQQVANLVLAPGYKFISTIPAGETNTHEHVAQDLVKVDTFAQVAPALVGAIRQEMAVVGAEAFKAIVFAPTAALADFYGHILGNTPGMAEVSVLHARISQNKRTKVTNDFRDAKAAILVATDVVARGMDFPGITTVFQAGMPGDKESYVHRLGRTARAGAEGRGIFIVSQAETFFSTWTLKEITLIPRAADLSSSSDVAAVAELIPEAQRAKIYQAWLGFYKTHIKPMNWDKEQLVAQANVFARDALRSPETPPICKSTVGKMGLKGTRGLVVVPDPPRAHRARGGQADK